MEHPRWCREQAGIAHSTGAGVLIAALVILAAKDRAIGGLNLRDMFGDSVIRPAAPAPTTTKCVKC